MTQSIIVNGERQSLTAGSILDLLRAEAIDPGRKGIAVALNGSVVPRCVWSETTLKSGDEIEVVRPFAGG